jgi:hypothetical protein
MIASPIEFKPRPHSVLQGLVPIVVFGLVGVLAAQQADFALWIRIVGPLGALAGIALLVWEWRAHAKKRILVDGTGISRRGLMRSRDMAWNDIESYRYLSVKQPVIASNRGGSGLAGFVAGVASEWHAQRSAGNHRYFGLGYVELHARGGAPPFRIGKDPFWGPLGGYDDMTALIEVILGELHQRLATTNDFAPFTITRTALSQADGREIAFAEIARVQYGTGKIIVVQRQPMTTWSTVPMQHVHNSLWFLQQLAKRGVAITVSPEVFLPSSARLSA